MRSIKGTRGSFAARREQKQRMNERVSPIAKHIEEYGWHSAAVLPCDEDDPQIVFAYSIGFEESYNHPEIIVFGPSRDFCHRHLSSFAACIKEGEKLETGKKTTGFLRSELPVIFEEVPKKHYDEFLGQAVDYYDSKSFRANVLFLPDRNGNFPGDEGYADPFPKDPFETYSMPESFL